MGGGISVYVPPKISLPYKFLLAVLFTGDTLTCFDFEIGMTSYNLYPQNEIPGYAPGGMMLSETYFADAAGLRLERPQRDSEQQSLQG